MEEKQADTLQPGQCIRPTVTMEQAKGLVDKLYGLTVTCIKELKSYDDRNFYIQVSTEHRNPHLEDVLSDGYVFKVLNNMDSQKKHIEAEHAAERLCTAAGLQCPVPVPNLQGQDYSHEKLPSATPNNNQNNGDEEALGNIVRLLTFVPGRMFVDVPYTPGLIHDAGKYLARLNNALQEFSHPSLEGHTSIWSLSSVPKLTEFLYAVTDEKRKALVNDVIKAFSKDVIPRLKNCSQGTIHGDFNEQNIVVKQSEENYQGAADYRIGGVIDFGDMTHSYHVFEVAIAIMYMMVESKVIDPMLAGGHLLAGYLSQRSLNDTEWELLKVCLASRYCQSLVLGAYTYSLDPTNEYVLVTAANGWSQLEKLWNTPTQQLYSSWKHIINSYKS